MKKIGICGVVVAALLVALPAVTPAAGLKKYKTTVTLDAVEFLGAPGRAARRAFGSYAFLGTIRSANARCRKGRKVIVTYKPDSGKRKTLGYDRSDSEGNWALRIDFTKYPSGNPIFMARAPKLKLSKSKLCKPDKSTTYEPVI